MFLVLQLVWIFLEVIVITWVIFFVFLYIQHALYVEVVSVILNIECVKLKNLKQLWFE